jgi:biotin transport system substrate-specific component
VFYLKIKAARSIHMSQSTNQLRLTVYSSLLAALVAAGAFISIPLGPVPITLQNLFVIVAGLLLGRKWGVACIAIYLLAGSLGLPVFSAGRGGIAHFAGPTGGYLFGYLAAVFCVGVIADKAGLKYRERSPQRYGFDLLAAAIGVLVIYAMGVPWLKVVAHLSWQSALTVGALPFLVGDIIKLCAAVIIAAAVRPLIHHGHDPLASIQD